MKRRTYQGMTSNCILAIASLALLGTCAISAGLVPTASALTYQENVDVNFTLLPAVSISLSSSDLIINNLTPGQNLDSNIITLTAASNSPAGYTISSTVGNSTDYTTTNLKHSTDTSATPAKFTSLATTDSIADLANLTAGYWGYSYSLDHGEHWINATKTGDVNNPGYSGLPLYTTETPTELLTVSTSASSTLDFKIAAAATATQASGEYNNVINFIAVAAPMPETPTMQSWTGCSTMSVGETITLEDERDGESYLVGKLADQKCWMLDNLRLDLTNSTILNGLTTSNTNVEANSLTSLKSGNRGAGAQYASSGFVKWDSSSPSDVYNQAKANADYKDTTTTSYGAGSGKIGVYYNFCAASAGSYCYNSGAGTGNAQYDLCPTGWRMPAGGSSGEYQALYNQYSSASEGQALAFRNALSTPFSGGYTNGSTGGSQGSVGRFWSSTYNSSSNIHNLSLGSSVVNPTNNVTRDYGIVVRCVLR